MIKEIINKLQSELPATVKLVAVSKFHPFEAIEEAYEAGQRIFGESRPQELLAKVKRLEEIRAEKDDPDYMSDIEWHFIGHLQTNKLKMVLPYASLIQSVDSVRLLEAINNWGRANNKVLNVLLECFISSDETKQGLSRQEVLDIISSSCRYDFIHISGVMGMATYTDDEQIIRADFQRLKEISDTMREHISKGGKRGSDCREISMGMSDDYHIAIEMGSTMIRVGSMIFGERKY
ncbi:MAG: YggS family pyridoxal phosphate-dependent enzyme [Bacteroidales bacterium]|nr:YggS family pyridoxal phosphate-dependent enzyme [Bacteroidales bacterium]